MVGMKWFGREKSKKGSFRLPGAAMGLKLTLPHPSGTVKPSKREVGENIFSHEKGGEGGRGAGYAKTNEARVFSEEQLIPRLPSVPQQHTGTFSATPQGRTVKA